MKSLGIFFAVMMGCLGASVLWSVLCDDLKNILRDFRVKDYQELSHEIPIALIAVTAAVGLLALSITMFIAVVSF